MRVPRLDLDGLGAAFRGDPIRSLLIGAVPDLRQHLLITGPIEDHGVLVWIDARRAGVLAREERRIIASADLQQRAIAFVRGAHRVGACRAVSYGRR